MPAFMPASIIAPFLLSFTSPGQLLSSQPAFEAQCGKFAQGVRLSRQSLLAALSAACISSPLSILRSTALETPRVTRRVQLEIAIGSDAPQQMIIGLYGDAAPESVKLFCAMCSGSLSPGLTYRGSVASRVEKDRILIMGRPTGGSGQVMERSIDSTGYVRTTLVNRADQYANEDDNSLQHNRAGLVSMRRGGGEFEFALVPAANPTLDKERIVVGEVVEGLDFLSDLNQVPSRQPAKDNEVGAIIYSLGAYDESKYLAVAKAGGDPRSRVDQAFRPLKKIKIVDCQVLD